MTDLEARAEINERMNVAWLQVKAESGWEVTEDEEMIFRKFFRLGFFAGADWGLDK
jgi:hypothetical protein